MAHPAGQAQLKEQAALIDALRQKYAEDEDVRTVTAVEKVLAEAARVSRETDVDAKALIQELTERNAQAKRDAAYPDEPDAHAKRVQNLISQKDSIQQSLQNTTKHIWQQELEEQQLLNREQELQSQEDDLYELTKIKEPQARNKLSLFMHVTRLNWRLDKSDAIAGLISDPSKNDIRQFEIDPKSSSQFETVQQIWQQITC